MKKHDEGYVLAYVTVILLLFCLIATGILTGAMKNMTNQQDTIQRMKDRYAAEGMIQKAIVMIKNNQNPGEMKEFAEDGITVITVLSSEQVGEEWKLVSSSGTVQIICTVDSSGNYKTFEIGTVQTEAGEG